MLVRGLDGRARIQNSHDATRRCGDSSPEESADHVTRKVCARLADASSHREPLYLLAPDLQDCRLDVRCALPEHLATGWQRPESGDYAHGPCFFTKRRIQGFGFMPHRIVVVVCRRVERAHRCGIILAIQHHAVSP